MNEWNTVHLVHEDVRKKRRYERNIPNLRYCWSIYCTFAERHIKDIKQGQPSRTDFSCKAFPRTPVVGRLASYHLSKLKVCLNLYLELWWPLFQFADSHKPPGLISLRNWQVYTSTRLFCGHIALLEGFSFRQPSRIQSECTISNVCLACLLSISANTTFRCCSWWWCCWQGKFSFTSRL